MPPPSFKQRTTAEKVEDYRQDLDKIELQLAQLKREYDLYFAGARRPNRPPFELKTELERLLRKWRTSTIQKIELTFRLNTLNSKFSAMNDVWDKILKRRETDPKALSPFGPTSAHVAAELSRNLRPPEPQSAPAPAAASAGAQAATAAREAAVAKPRGEDLDTRLQRVYNDYVDAKKDLGEAADGLSYTRFKAQLEKQVGQIQAKTNCKDVEFTVTRKGGKVGLTAKPITE